MDRCSGVQVSHLIGIYLALLMLGVFLEEDVRHGSHQPPDSDYNNQAMVQTQPLKKLAFISVGTDNFRAIRSAITSPDVESGSVDALTYFDPRNMNVYTDLEKKRNILVSKQKPLRSSTLAHKMSLNSEFKYHEDHHSLKRSLELNAFDEIVNFLTGSATYCTLLDSEQKTVSYPPESVYHCAQNSYRRCSQSDSKSKHKIFRRCTNSKRLTGYDVLPSHLVQSDDERKTSTVNNQSKDKTNVISKVPKYNINVDADYTFIEEFKTLRYAPIMRLDFTIDLMGLNSLHKYEVVAKLVKVIRAVLIRQRYFMERSSADSGQLQEYLFQEGLDQPLYILTLWQQYL